ncbi:unnamed protein product [Blepharisma stoltei]|uniref:Uncharacterized protein n=1 Tax=Blepharisma stoltei TaxID=1481888 RepID=A0AAU9K301_9CILI|nr:unnamed protein product [Blepharisma stoltei]
MRVFRKFSISPWITYPVDDITATKTRIFYSLLSDNTMLKFTPVKAVFSRRKEEFLVVKRKGFMKVEFIPRKIDANNFGKIENDYDSAKLFQLQPEDIDSLLTSKEGTYEYKQKIKKNFRVLRVEKTAGDWKWAVAQTSISPTGNQITSGNGKTEGPEVVVNAQEMFIIKHFFNFTIPYLMGWQVIKDDGLAKFSMESHDESLIFDEETLTSN